MRKLYIALFTLFIACSCVRNVPIALEDQELELRIQAIDIMKWWCTEEAQPNPIYYFVNIHSDGLRGASDLFLKMIDEMKCPTRRKFVYVHLPEKVLSKIFYKNENWKILVSDKKNFIAYEIQMNQEDYEIKWALWVVQIHKEDGNLYSYEGYGTQINLPIPD